MKCLTCNREQKRSTEQNKRYWKLISLLADKKIQEQSYSIESWHTYCKFKFLGGEELKLPNGKEVLRPRGSSGLTVSEFNDYMTEVESWAGENGIYLDE